MNPPPHLIRTARLVVRCWDPRDAAELREVTAASREHLAPWLPWAWHEPQTLDEKVALLRGFRGQFDLDQDHVYGIFDAHDGSIVGGTGLHPRVGPEAREIGYWIRHDRTGRGYASEAVAGVVRAAFEVARFARLEIRCEPANEPSRRVARSLGFRLEGQLRAVLAGADADAPRRDLEVYGLLASELHGSPSARADVTFEDAAGRAIP